MYSIWAEKRRKRSIYVLVGIGMLALSVYITVGLYKPPSCFDGKMNQDELETDCGGSCALLCPAQTQPLKTVWVRSFEVAPGMWSAFAYLENPNPNAEVLEAKYKFTLYDKTNTVIKEVEGMTFITQETILPVFQGRIEVGEATPYRTEFVWLTTPLVWSRPKNIYKVEIEEQNLANSTTKPEVTGVVVNKEAFPLEDVEVFAMVYDTQGNAIAVSKTVVERVAARGKEEVTFSWPYPFNAFPYRWQLVARVPVQEGDRVYGEVQ